MYQFFNDLAFGLFPYVALSVFLIGSLLRYEYSQQTWKTGSSQFLRAGQLRWGSNLFHIGILALFFGHLFGLLTPTAVYQAFGMSSGTKQVIAIVAGGVFGIICLIGLVLLLHRRFADPRIRATSAPMDNFILLLILAQLVLGLLTLFVSVQHLDGSVMVQLATWAQKIVTFRAGAADYVLDVHWIYKAHMLLGLVMFLVFPFSRLVHIWSAPIAYLLRPYQVVRRRVARPKGVEPTGR